MKAHSPTYTIPNMTVREIVEYLSDNGFNILDADITNPNGNYICRLYEGILSVFIEQKVPEGISDSCCIIIVYTYMKRFMERIGFGVFQLKDVIQPEPHRVVKVLSTAINFALFKESKRDVLQAIYRKAEEEQESLEAHRMEVQRSKELLNDKKQEVINATAQAEELQREIQEKELEIVNFHRIQQTFTNEVEALKREHAEVSERITAEKYQLMSATQDITRLQAKIVRNPEELREMLVRMTDQLAHDEESLKEYEKKVIQLNRSVHTFKGVVNELKSLVCTVSLVGEYNTRVTQCKSMITQLTHENNNLEMENRSSTSKKVLLEKKIGYIVDKMDGLVKEEEVRMIDMRKEFERLRERHSCVLHQREVAQQAIQKNNQEIKHLEKEVINLETSHQSNLSSVYNDLMCQKNFLMGYAEDLEKVFKGEYQVLGQGQ